MKNHLIILLLIFSLYASAQKHQGDLIFEQNKTESSFEFQNINDIVEIGNLVNPKTKHGIILQQFDSIANSYQLKLMCYNSNEITEKIIDTLELGILVDFKFIDKNIDGNKDLMLTIGGNRAFDLLYVFDQTENTLVKITNFINYPQTEQIGDTKFLFSYIAQGCADYVWKSSLIAIENFKVAEYGFIYGNGCEVQEKDNYIIINYKKEQKIKYAETLQKYKNGKFDFIKQYWNNEIDK